MGSGMPVYVRMLLDSVTMDNTVNWRKARFNKDSELWCFRPLKITVNDDVISLITSHHSWNPYKRPTAIEV